MLGELVNNYRIIHLIAEGGMGSIYSAEHTLIGKRVAIKVLRPELAVDPNLVNRFFNEARVISGVKHPNIVEVMDFGSLPNGMPYMVMELLRGETVSARLERERHLTVTEALDITLQSASALAAAHSAEVVHRDLKPENLFLVRDERDPSKELIKVLDFGIAKHRDDEASTSVKTKFGSFLGTPAYMSPEQCRGVPDGVDHRSDIYGLAVCLYEMLCGGPPFTAEGYGDIMVMQITHAPTSPRHIRPDVPERLDAALLKALEKDPEDRFQTMSAFAAALDPARRLLVAVDRPSIAPGPALAAEVTGLSSTAQSNVTPRPAGGATQAHVRGDLHNTIDLPSPAASLTHSAAAPSPAPAAAEQPNAADSSTPTNGMLLPREVRAPRNKLWLLLAALGGALATLVAWQTGLFSIGEGETSEATTAAQQSSAATGSIPGKVVTVTRTALPEAQAPVDEQPGDNSSGHSAPPPTPGQSVKNAGANNTGAAVSGTQASNTESLKRLPDTAQPDAIAATGNSGRTLKVNNGRAARAGAAQAVVADATMTTKLPRAAGRSNRSKATPSSRTLNKPRKRGASVGSASQANPAKTPEPPTSSAEQEPKGAFGLLRLDASPWAVVKLGSRTLGATPLIDVKLPAGTHVLVLKNAEVGHETTFAVTIAPDKTTRRVVGWGK